MNAINLNTLKKYRILLVLIGAFFALIMILASFTYVMSNRIAKATQELELSATQTVLVQQLSKNLFDINLYLDNVANHQEKADHDPVQELPTDTTQEQTVLIDNLPQSAIYQL